MMENAFINVKNRSHDITVDMDVPAGGANGVLLAQGGRFGGWTIFVRDNRPVYEYNYMGQERYVVRSSTPLPKGKVTLRYVFLYDGPKPGQGGTEIIDVNGAKVAEGKIGKTHQSMFSADDAADVGMDEGTPVSDQYGQWDNGYAGTIKSITIKTSATQLTPEETQKLLQQESDDAVAIE